MSSNAARGTSKQQQQQQKDATSTVIIRCDICQMKANFKKMTLLTCRTCQVHVHRQCYEGVGTNTADHDDDDNEFVCRACHAVGKSIKGRKRSAGKRKHISKTLLQVQRPMECCLCSAPQGIHAMHPLFDHSGSRGRQIILPADERHGKPERLAWVHSLCAYSVCFLKKTAGCVYGCNRRGHYLDGDGTFTNEDPSEDDDLSINSDLSRQTGQDDLVRIYHFAYCLPTMRGATNEWTKRIHELQQTLKCTICGLSDKSSNSLRIPVQCRANEENEYEGFRDTHLELGAELTCTQALHVGCAMWGVDSNHPVHRRVYYFPGNQDEGLTEPVVEVYCDAHARDVAATQKTNANHTTELPPTTYTLDQVAERRLRGLKVTKAATPRPPTEHAPTRKTTVDKPHPYAQKVRDGSSGAAKTGLKKSHSSTAKANGARKQAAAVTVGTALNSGHSPNTAPKKSVHIPEGGNKSTLGSGKAPRRTPLLDNIAKHSNESALPKAKSHDVANMIMTTSIRRHSSTALSPPLTSPTSERPVASIPLDALPPPPYAKGSRRTPKPAPTGELVALGRNHSKRGKKQKTANTRQDDYLKPRAVEGSREPTLPVAEADRDEAMLDEAGQTQSTSLTLNRSNGDLTTSSRPTGDAGTESVPRRKRGRPRRDSKTREEGNAPTNVGGEARPGQDDEAPETVFDDNDGMTDVFDSPEPDEVALENPGRWGHLKAGPHYSGMFDFGDWDTYEKR